MIRIIEGEANDGSKRRSENKIMEDNTETTSLMEVETNPKIRDQMNANR